ncbi:MAG: ArsR family transcriptional regulator [Phycisphaeraceae bacterium]|nr:ArsR family transcriptional regulator [Phycisphaeraceae bacterium]
MARDTTGEANGAGGAGVGGGDDPGVTLRAAQDQFIACWGKMGSAWGISRTMAEVHALLFITGEPMCTDDIMERLQISRGNASMSIRALLDWGVVARAHRRGDRKEYFKAEQDVWAMFRAIVRERMKREADPALVSLHEIRDLTSGVDSSKRKGRRRGGRDGVREGGSADETAARIMAHNQRLDEMLKFFETVQTLTDRFVSPSGRGLQIAASILGKAAS